MSTQQATEQIMECILNRITKDKEDGKTSALPLSPDSNCIAVARVGATDQKMVFRTLSEMPHVEMGGPLHSLVIVGDMHALELQAIRLHAL